MNAIDLLIAQHRRMETLAHEVLDHLKQHEGATDIETQATTARLFARAADELTAHIASEEEIFFPAVKAQRTEDILLESLEEHLSLKRLLADLIELDMGDTTFLPKFKVLREQMEHHHKEEEEHLFPKVRQRVEAGQLDALGAGMLTLQQRLQQEGAPREAVSDQTDAAAPLA
ncbi:MAG: hemerythrin domain-containing protein [Aquabacterium sp.]